MLQIKPETQLKILLQIWMITFLSAAVVFLFYGNTLLQRINDISIKLTPSLSLINLPQEKFWMTLTLSLMVTLVFLCYLGQKNIRQNHNVVLPILVSKFVSSFFFFVFFITVSHSLAYLVGLFVDGSIFLITYFAYDRWKTEMKRADYAS